MVSILFFKIIFVALTDAFVSLMTGSNNFGVDGAPLSFVGVTSKHPEERLVGGHFVLDIPQGSPLLEKSGFIVLARY